MHPDASSSRHSVDATIPRGTLSCKIASTTHADHRSLTARPMWVSLVLIALLGVLTGALTLLGQKYLPRIPAAVRQLILGVVGHVVRGRLARSPTNLGDRRRYRRPAPCIAGLYTASFIALRLSLGTCGNAAFWTIGGVLGGPVLGLAGNMWRHSLAPWPMLATAALGASFLCEGWYLLVHLEYEIGYAFLAVGGISTLLLSPTGARIRSLAAAVAISIPLAFISTYGFSGLNEFLARM